MFGSYVRKTSQHNEEQERILECRQQETWKAREEGDPLILSHVITHIFCDYKNEKKSETKLYRKGFLKFYFYELIMSPNA